MAYLVLPWIVFWMWTLYDLVKRPDEIWRDAGESKTTWFVLVFVLQLYGVIAYHLRIRPTLVAHEAHAADRHAGVR